MSTVTNESTGYGNRFFSGVAVLAISTFIVKIIGMFYKIPMIAYLGSEGMGYFNSAYEIYSMFFVISTTGIPVALSILISENKAKNRFSNIKKIYRLSLILLGAIGLLGTVIMAVFYNRLSAMINNDLAALSILAISPTLFMICISSAIRGYFQGNEIMVPTAVSQIIEALGKLLLGLGFAIIAIKRGYDTPRIASFAVFGITVGVAASLLYLMFYKLFYKMKSKCSADSIINQTEPSKIIIKNILNIAIPITISSTILGLTKIIDMLMILTRLGSIGYSQEQSNAIYGSYSTMAISIYNLPSTFVSAIALPLVPMLTGAIETNNKPKEKNSINIAFKITALIAFPAGLGISVFSKSILRLLFSSQKSEIEYVAPLLSLLGLSVFLTAMITTTNAILQSYKLATKPIISMIVGILIKIALAHTLIGIPKINIYGAPISTFISTIAIVALNSYFILKASGSIDSVFKLFALPFIAASISVVIGIAFNLISASLFSERIAILIVIIVVAISYLFAILKLKILNEDELSMLPKGPKIISILKKLNLI